jgi:hypothetical protein
MLKRLVLSSVVLLFAASSLVAQTPTTQGKDFWVSYMKNGHRPSTNPLLDCLKLFVSSSSNCQVTLSNADGSWFDQFDVTAGVVYSRTVPDDQGYNDQNEGIADRGIHVTSSDTISLYIGNEAYNSYDAANILPTSALGTAYMIQTCNSVASLNTNNAENIRASFLVVATEDNTAVQITPTASMANHQAGTTYTIELDRGQVYHVMTSNSSTSGNTNGDFSGTTIVSDKPISVFNGNCLVSVPGGLTYGYDHVFEQAMPIDYWGKKIVVTSSGFVNHGVGADLVKITALNDNTDVYRDGILLRHLHAGESTTFDMELSSVPCTYLESNNPVAVFLYNHSHGNNPNYGDPSMVWISPVEQTMEEVTFSTFKVQEVNTHYVNIVCYAQYVSEMTFDGNNIASEFSPVPGNPEFSYTRKNIVHGPHTLICPGGFVAYVYGIGEAEGYAYSVGSSAKILTNQLYVDDMLSSEFPDGYNTCQLDTLQFRVETNYEIDHVAWNFGDGNHEIGSIVPHVYEVSDSFNVESVVYRMIDDEVQPFDTLSMMVRVNPIKEFDDEPKMTCGDTYHYNEVDYSVPGNYDVSFETIMGCDSIVHLHLVKGEVTTYTCSPVIACESYKWFDSVYRQTNHYLQHLVEEANPEGCDSLYVLDLTIGHIPPNTDAYYESCDTFVWHGIECTETNEYHARFTTPEGGCDYDSVLYFTRLFEPPFEEILGQSNVAVSTSYWPGKYVYSLDDSTGMNHDDIHWKLLGNPGWGMEIKGFSCVIRTGVMGSATLHVWTTDNELCYKEAFKSINCSGFNVGENGITSIEIYPNPARDEVIIKGEDLESVVLYDVTGRRIRAVPAYHEEIVTVHVNDLSPGLYLAEIQSSKYNITRLVSVMK